MIKSVDKPIGKKEIFMHEMKPYDIGVISDTHLSKRWCCNGHVVMRTADPDIFEVFDLTRPSEKGSCWGDGCEHLVRLLAPGESITLIVE